MYLDVGDVVQDGRTAGRCSIKPDGNYLAGLSVLCKRLASYYVERERCVRRVGVTLGNPVCLALPNIPQ